MLHPYARPLTSQSIHPSADQPVGHSVDLAYLEANGSPHHRLRYPIAPWIGRLISPNHRSADDSVEFEVYHAPSPHQRLIRQVVSLQWGANQTTQTYVQSVIRDIRFNAIAHRSTTKGRIHPIRLNGLNQVGPLESLTAARFKDDIEVILHEPIVMSEPGGQTILVIDQEPIQVTGTFYSVVTIRERLSAPDNTDRDPGRAQTNQHFRVQHYNPVTQQFDGLEEIMRIPNGPLNAVGIYRFTNQNIETSVENLTGWYIYGHMGADGIFVAQALEAYRCLSLEPDRIILDQHQGSHYIEFENWANTPAKAESLETVLIDGTAENPKEAIAQWKEGDRFLMMHLFGGIGGNKQDEKQWFGLVPGHFSYGVGTVVRDPLTQALRFDLDYHQIYAHNKAGIISGRLKRCCYVGDLERGWLNLRPISDIVVKLDCITQDYHFGSIMLSPFKTFMEQLQVMMARYRVGDGTGASLVDAARCCVQDSNQALYVALQQLEDDIEANPNIQTWIKDHPHDPQTKRFRQLQQLGADLNHKLVPLGIVRPDWQENADRLTGIATPSTSSSTSSSTSLSKDGPSNVLSTMTRALISWRTMLPRRSHDEMAKLLLKHGAKLWFIRTNQVGGTNADIIPYAPTTLVGGLRGRND